MNNAKIINREIEYSNPWFNVVAKDVCSGSSGEPHRHYMIQPADCVVILAETDEGQAVMVRQYRPAVESDTLEFPSGHIEPGEDPAAAAHREFAEETGYQAQHMELLSVLDPDTGRLANKLWCFLGGGLRALHHAAWRKEEGVDVVLLSKEQIRQSIVRGELRHSQDLAVLTLAIIKNKWGNANGT